MKIGAALSRIRSIITTSEASSRRTEQGGEVESRSDSGRSGADQLLTDYGHLKVKPGTAPFRALFKQHKPLLDHRWGQMKQQCMLGVSMGFKAWRYGEATGPQLDLLRELGSETTSLGPLNRGRASDLISMVHNLEEIHEKSDVDGDPYFIGLINAGKLKWSSTELLLREYERLRC